MRRTEEEAVLKRTHWLAIERENEWMDHAALGAMATDLRTAILGFQLWAPVGWDGLILDCTQNDDASLTVQRVDIPEAYSKPFWGRVLGIGKLDPPVLGRLVEGAFGGVESGAVPVVNPFRFLEIGLQTAVNHRRAGAVLWMMGLDGLL